MCSIAIWHWTSAFTHAKIGKFLIFRHKRHWCKFGTRMWAITKWLIFRESTNTKVISFSCVQFKSWSYKFDTPLDICQQEMVQSWQPCLLLWLALKLWTFDLLIIHLKIHAKLNWETFYIKPIMLLDEYLLALWLASVLIIPPYWEHLYLNDPLAA